MDLLQNLALGLQSAFSLINLGYCFLGVLIGTLVGICQALAPLPPLPFYYRLPTPLTRQRPSLCWQASTMAVNTAAQPQPF